MLDHNHNYEQHDYSFVSFQQKTNVLYKLWWQEQNMKQNINVDAPKHQQICFVEERFFSFIKTTESKKFQTLTMSADVLGLIWPPARHLSLRITMTLIFHISKSCLVRLFNCVFHCIFVCLIIANICFASMHFFKWFVG